MDAMELYQAGRLDEAVVAAGQEIRDKPGDLARRWWLCELLCCTGAWPRVDLQLETISELDPKSAVGVALFRQLLRAETWRQQFYAEGRVPELTAAPTPQIALRLEASICLREGNLQGAAERLATAEKSRPLSRGQCDGADFNDFRDADDLTAAVLEVFSTTGKFFWVDFVQIEKLEIRPPKRLRDLVWRPARLAVRGGPDGEVFLPILYPGSHLATDERLKLGRLTDWIGDAEAGEPVRGIGQRVYLAGDHVRPIGEIQTVTFSDAEAP